MRNLSLNRSDTHLTGFCDCLSDLRSNIYIYIYIYIELERVRERARKRKRAI